MRFRAVFFDAGGTIMHPSPSFHRLFAAVLAESGSSIGADEIREKSGFVSERFVRAARDGELWTTSAERSQAFWHSVYDTYLEALGIADAVGLADRLYATFSDPSNYELFEDSLPVMRELDVAGLQQGVISNFEGWLDGFLDASVAGRFLSVRAISGLEGVEKPDPRIFEIALGRSGLEPQECVYVGDSLEFDVEPAGKAGMYPVLIDRRGGHEGANCARIASMHELPGVIGL